MSHKQSILGVCRFYNAEEALTLLVTLKMNLPLKVKMKVILLTLLNIRLEPIQIFKQ